jgi:thioredoxin-dependent peroxiredoxin
MHLTEQATGKANVTKEMMDMKLKEGMKAPDFKILASNGEVVALKDFKGKRVVLYFYPKDDTPGCTKQACGFRDIYRKIEKAGAVIFGVSPDSVKSHEKFIDKFSLPFLLLADEDKKLCQSYGVWVKKSMYGREYMGVQRATFILSKEGKIDKIYPKVDTKIHDQEVFEYLTEAEAKNR